MMSQTCADTVCESPTARAQTQRLTCRLGFSAALRNSARPLASASMTQMAPAAASSSWDSTGPVLAAPSVKSPATDDARE